MKLTDKQRDLLAKTLVDIAKLVFVALVLAQILSERQLSISLFVFGGLILIILTGLSIFILREPLD